MSRRLRLLKVTVQPTFIADDGERVEEVEGQAFVVPAGHWREYAAKAFDPDDMDVVQAAYDQATPPWSEPGEVVTD